MRNTVLARKTIRNSNLPHYGNFFTNKYENCRTVKVNVRPEATDKEILETLELLEAVIPNSTAKCIKSQGYFHSMRSLIVRVPITF